MRLILPLFITTLLLPTDASALGTTVHYEGFSPLRPMRLLLLLFVASLLLIPKDATAIGMILLYQGEVDDREVYFADIRTISNRTPMNQILKSTETWEIDVTAVYEHEKKPEFVHMKLQFRCPAAYTLDETSHKLTANKSKVRAGDTVTFSIGPGSYKLRRSDLQSEPIPVSDWRTSDATMLSRAGAVACNNIAVDQALHQSIKGEDFDFDGFGQKIAQLGLPADISLIGPTLSPEFLDFAWSQLWHDKVRAGKRPDPSGKWSRRPTDEEKAAAIKKIQKAQADAAPAIEAAKSSLLAGIKKSQAAAAARQDKDTSSDGRKRPRIEANLVTIWRGRPESEVVNAMGNPEFNQSGDSRFLRYTRSWEKRGTTVYNAYGQPLAQDIGGFALCFVEFKTKQDSSGDWRVDDILVRADEEGAGENHAKSICQDLASQAAR